MDGSMMLMAYPASNGQDVTVSPRLSSGHVEPSYTSNVTIQLLPGTGIVGGTLTANGRCTGCRKWSGNSIDVKSTAQKMIFAYGPGYVGNPDSVNADTRFHSTYGVFTMDMVKATGPGGVPSSNIGPNLGSIETSITRKSEFSAPIHGVYQISCSNSSYANHWQPAS